MIVLAVLAGLTVWAVSTFLAVLVGAFFIERSDRSVFHFAAFVTAGMCVVGPLFLGGALLGVEVFRRVAGL